MTTENSFKGSGEISLTEIGEFLGITGEVSMLDLYNVSGKKIFDNKMYGPNVPTDISLPISMDNFYNIIKKFLYTINITGDHIDVDYLNISTLLTSTTLPTGITRTPDIPWDNSYYEASITVNIENGANLSGKNVEGGSTLRTGNLILKNFIINNYGNIWGRGGNGGRQEFRSTGNIYIFNSATPNINGKNAILVEQNCKIINYSTGKIYGGGGGGSSGRSTTQNSITYAASGGGSGAGGATGGTGGINGTNSINSITSVRGISFGNGPSLASKTTIGANGGSFGNNGQPKRLAFNSFIYNGGTAGKSIIKTASNITVTISNQGTILGPNDATII